MKYNYLKKAGAVALAAVMAVTFAPVASLNVLAGDKVAGGGTALSGTDSITGKGSAELSSNVTDLTVSGSDVQVTIDLKGHDLTLAKSKLPTNAAIKIVNSAAVKKTNKGAAPTYTLPTVTIGDSKNVVTDTSITLSGNMLLAGNYTRYPVSGGSVKVDGNVAKVESSGSVIALGDEAIQAAFESCQGTKVEALQGAVSIDGLEKDDCAFVDKDAIAGTTIKATSAKGVTLQKYVTTYGFYYSNAATATGVLQTNFDGTENSGKSELTTVFYRAGTKNGAGVKTQSAIAYGTATPDYTPFADAAKANASQFFLDTLGKDAKGEKQLYAYENTRRGAKFGYTTAITISKDKDWATDGAKVGYSAGNEYFTEDPTADTVTGSGIVVVDNDKYSVTKEDVKDTVKTIFDGTTYEVKRNPKYTDKGGSKESYWNFATGKDAKVSVPKDSSLVQVTVDKKSGVATGTTKYNYISGSKNADKMANDAQSQLDTDTNAKEALNVEQIGDGVDALTFEKVDQGTDVTRGEGIGFYKVLNTSYNDSAKVAQDTYTFGPTAKVTESFIKKASGYTNGKTKVDPEWKTETVFASKEIKTTVANVPSGVTLQGEVSAKIKTVNADGTKTWNVNGGSEPAVAAYRLYDKTRGEHVYTISATERDMLVKAGWIYEGEAFKVHSVASGDGVGIYRVYNPNNGGMHHYTTSKAEVDMLLSKGWTEGKVVFYAADKETGIEVLRTYNVNSKNGEHHYTSNPVENQNLINLGWKAEGVAFYAFK